MVIAGKEMVTHHLEWIQTTELTFLEHLQKKIDRSLTHKELQDFIKWNLSFYGENDNGTS